MTDSEKILEFTQSIKLDKWSPKKGNAYGAETTGFEAKANGYDFWIYLGFNTAGFLEVKKSGCGGGWVRLFRDEIKIDHIIDKIKALHQEKAIKERAEFISKMANTLNLANELDSI